MRVLIDWFIDSKVAANLLMIFILVGGGITLIGLKQEVFPNVDPDMITVSVVYPGATPEEIEEGICIKIEEEVEGLDGVKRITSTASENIGVVAIELFEGEDKQEVLDDVKVRVDAISTFPEDAEKPVISTVEMMKQVINLILSGPADPLALRNLAQEIRDEIAALPEVSRVELTNAVDFEISIEVSEDALRRYGLTFDDVSRAVRQASLNLSGGTVKTVGGEILLRSDTQAYVGEDFEEILLLRSPDGTRVKLGDVATVVDEFEDVDQWSTVDGEPAMTLTVFRIGEQSAPTVAGGVYRYLDAKRPTLPEGMKLGIGNNWEDILRQRRTLLLNNGAWGLALIFILLLLFLRFRLALWVSIGIPTALMGAIWLLPSAGASINMMSLFGFITVLGILVDDAIVVAENIHYQTKLGKGGVLAAKVGTREVMVPVILAVLTTIAAFIPMLSLPGWMGKFARAIPIVVICALIFSLLESLLILPHHLAHLKAEVPGRKKKFRVTGLLSFALFWWVDHVYRPTLRLALEWRYFTLATGFSILLVAGSLFGGGIIKFVFMPPIEGDQIIVSLTMPEGTPVADTTAALERISSGVENLKSKYEGDRPGSIFVRTMVSVGSQPQASQDPTGFNLGTANSPNLAEVFVQLRPPEERGEIRSEMLMHELRQYVGDIPGARELRYDVAINRTDSPISLELKSSDLAALRTVADRVKARLARFNGAYDITDDLVAGKREIRLFVTPQAEALGITQSALALQVRQAFYGDEAQRIQRGRDEVKVMVRYPKESRRSLADLEDMRIRLPDGGEVPFSTVATIEEGRGPSIIHRTDSRRTVTVNCELDLAVANANEIVTELKKEGGFLSQLDAEFPHVDWSFEGEQREQSETLLGLFKGMVIALLLIFTLLALVFGSFTQPLIVLLAIPFGFVGAVLGHVIMGLSFTMLSMIGVLAMAGVVVNDSMILIDFVNRRRAAGATAWEAVMESGPRRFRAILLTSLTTFAGLTPLILEKSVQAQFLIPMAISLSFGVMFSTIVILFVVPATYLIFDDVARLFGRTRREEMRTGERA